MPSLLQMYPDQPLLVLADSVRESVEAADAIALVTAWDVFRTADFGALAAVMKTPLLFDGRNLFDPEQVAGAGFRYFAIGRGESI